MLAAHVELELAAAVTLDVAFEGVLDAVEQRLHGAEPGRFDVEPARLERQRLDGRHTRDGMVPAHPALLAVEELAGLLGESRILDDPLGEAVEHAPVVLAVDRVVHRRPLVVALQVEDADRAGGREALDQVVGPVRCRVEFELRVGLDLEPPFDALGGRWLAESGADDEPNGVVPPVERAPEVRFGLAERQVERGAFEPPPTVVLEVHPLGLATDEQVALVERVRERVQRVLAGEVPGGVGLGQRVVFVGLVGHVLAATHVTVAGEREHRRRAGEPARRLALAALERTLLDRQREVGDPVVERHGSGFAVPKHDGSGGFGPSSRLTGHRLEPRSGALPTHIGQVSRV